MTAKMVFDPLTLLIEVFNELCPGKHVDIFWCTSIRQEHNSYSQTIFPEDGGRPMIHLDVDTKMADVVEALMHELATVAAAGLQVVTYEEIWKELHARYESRAIDLQHAGRQEIEYVGGVQSLAATGGGHG